MPSFTPQAAAGAVQRLLLVLGLSTLAGVLVAGLLLPFFGGLGLAARSSAESFQELPSELTTRPLAQRTVIVDRDGRTIAQFYDENRIYVPLRKIAPIMQKAILAIEDERFYEHGPIDLRGTTRALVRNLQSGEVVQGGSTLTQQYVKLLLIDQAETKADIAAATSTTPQRKLRELRLAIAAEERFTKDQILERYLNIAYFGDGAYGIEAAARHYFSKPASKLLIREAALLAGLVQSPSRYDPTRNPAAAKQRRDVVLRRMVETGAITPAQAAKARQRPLTLKVQPNRNGCVNASYAPFFCDFVYRELLETPSLGKTRAQRERLIKRGGLIVRTTVDWKAQRAAEKAIAEYVNPTDSVAAALAMVEPGTGEIRAMAQSRGYGQGRGRTFVNYAADKDRGNSSGFQPGSTFKAFVLAAAIQQGMPLNYSIYAPEQANVSGQPFETCDGVVRPPDYAPRSSTGSGRKDLRSGTEESNNTFYVLLEQRTGLCDPARIAKKLGVTRADGSDLEQVPSFTLGVGEVSPLAMAEAYATFAAGGVHCRSIAITEITSRAGKKFAPPKANCQQAIDEDVANAVTQVLRGVIDGPNPRRTGARMSLGRPAAGKTGTTQDTKAVWFVGMVPQLAAAVAVADPETNARPLYGRRIGGIYYGRDDVCGGCIPGPIWQLAMQGALQGVPPKDFANPDPRVVEGGEATVPDVRGMTENQAFDVLQAAGFRPTIGGYVDSVLDYGLVVGTGPEAGSEIRTGDEVRLYLSNGASSRGGERQDLGQDTGTTGTTGDTAGTGGGGTGGGGTTGGDTAGGDNGRGNGGDNGRGNGRGRR